MQDLGIEGVYSHFDPASKSPKHCAQSRVSQEPGCALEGTSEQMIDREGREPHSSYLELHLVAEFVRNSRVLNASSRRIPCFSVLDSPVLIAHPLALRIWQRAYRGSSPKSREGSLHLSDFGQEALRVRVQGARPKRADMKALELPPSFHEALASHLAKPDSGPAKRPAGKQVLGALGRYRVPAGPDGAPGQTATIEGLGGFRVAFTSNTNPG